jgi:hypothetical protein
VVSVAERARLSCCGFDPEAQGPYLIEGIL